MSTTQVQPVSQSLLRNESSNALPVAKLTIEVSDRGIGRIVSKPRTIAEANREALLSARLAAPIRFLHEVAAGEQVTSLSSPNPQVWVNRSVEDDPASFEQLDLCVAEAPRNIFKNAPDWITGAVRAAYPNDFRWKSAETLPGGEQEVALTILTETPGLSNGQRNEWLQNYGWCDDETYGTLLVAEPFILRSKDIASLTWFCTKARLMFRIVGTSNCYPGATLRIEIKPLNAR